MKTIVEFSACFLEPIMRFADQDGVQEKLIGMQAIPAAKGGVLLAASNGHVAIIARDPQGRMVGNNPIVFAPEAKLVEASVAHPRSRFYLTDAGLAVIFDRKPQNAGESLLDTCLTAGKARLIKCDPLNIASVFPEQAAPDVGSASSFSLNAHYVGMFSDSFSAMAGMERDDREGVELRCELPEAGRRSRKILVLPITNHVEAAGVIMNIHADPVAYTKDWMQARAKPRVRVVPGGRLVA
ncbi:hypothetical protein [Halomonas salipaludis]|uniref:Uncharacterized protein n=1 Tax=Halomonas salipaludis TaxID=2032625 RepID=A0A2A2F3T7_9GAMM|nr:hypothetical protein [Halomonas salipaludis]PAU79183.1 hypothetical protein CK498_02105 [Halomonas salipaludis]